MRAPAPPGEETRWPDPNAALDKKFGDKLEMVMDAMRELAGSCDRKELEILSNVVDCIFEGGDPGGQVNEHRDLRRLRVSTGLEAILAADTRAH